MRKTQELRVMVTRCEHAALREIAKQEGLKLSETLRQVIREEAKRRCLWGDTVARVHEVGRGEAE